MRVLKLAGKVLFVLVVLVVVAAPFVIGIRPFIGPKVRPLTDRHFESTPARLERGKYLVEAVNGCLHCHSELDWDAPGFRIKAGTEGSGRNWGREGLPWVSASNLTPDKATGAGDWTDDMLARAIREGIGHDGRALFPLMPYPRYRTMPDEDLAAIIVYIRALKPIAKTPAPTTMPFPLNRFINAVPEPVTEPVPQPDRADRVAYGAHLVRMGACGDCHTPMDAQGMPVPGMDFAGGFPVEGPHPPVASANITQDASGIPYYDESLFLEVMHTGKAKARPIHSAMPWSIYGNQTDDDLKAMFAYVKTIAPVQHRVDNTLPPTLCPRCGLVHGGGDRNTVRQ